MRGDVTVINRRLKDLNPLVLGEESCLPSHSYGPMARKYTLIHFVYHGHGTFYRGGISYQVKKGEAFIIRPNEITTYCASDDDPWYYRWIGFDGELSKKFEQLDPVFTFTTDWANEMLSLDCDTGILEYAIAAKLFMMYTEFFADTKHKNDYVGSVKSYVNALYMQQLRVEEIAEKMNLDRRYLSRIFKAKVGKSIQEYIVSVRMEEAKKLLEKGYSVVETAQLCGYEDVCNFSKMFKRECGISPGGWKKK